MRAPSRRVPIAGAVTHNDFSILLRDKRGGRARLGTRRGVQTAHRHQPIFRSFIPNSVFINFLSVDFEGVTQQKVGVWRVYRPNLFSESMIFG